MRYLIQSQLFLLEHSSIPFFPNIPPKIDHDSIYTSFLCFVEFGTAFAPVAMY
jgi:hypothetical protein